jgi:hypothetical protein
MEHLYAYCVEFRVDGEGGMGGSATSRYYCVVWCRSRAERTFEQVRGHFQAHHSGIAETVRLLERDVQPLYVVESHESWDSDQSATMERLVCHAPSLLDEVLVSDRLHAIVENLDGDSSRWLAVYRCFPDPLATAVDAHGCTWFKERRLLVGHWKDDEEEDEEDDEEEEDVDEDVEVRNSSKNHWKKKSIKTPT